MPIFANNMINTQKEEPKAPPVEAVKPVQVIKPLEEVSMVPRTKIDKKHHALLLVDGKEKKISKHSAYLLDMLTLDNE